MYVPDTFGASVILLFLCMLCWGSWANAFSLTKGKYRFELFYWDYAVGVLLGVLALSAFMAPKAAVFQGTMDPTRAAWGIFSGVVFSIGNVLLVAAVSLTGMAVAFPVCCGLALLIAVGLSLWINPAVPVAWMCLGAGMILLSMIMDAAAYRSIARDAASSTRGIVIAIIGGICMGAFPPCSEKAFEGPNGLDAYSAAIMLGVGVLAWTILTNYLLMRWPITGAEPAPLKKLFTAPPVFHVLGILGGVVWAAGDIFYSIAANKVGAAMSYSFGMGGILVAAVWGVFVWNEFRGAPKRTYLYLLGMFVLFIAGIAVIAWAKSTMPAA